MKDKLLKKAMEVVCELCKWPEKEQEENEDYLKNWCDHCEDCPAELAIKEALQKLEQSVSTQFAHIIADSLQEILDGTNQ